MSLQKTVTLDTEVKRSTIVNYSPAMAMPTATTATMPDRSTPVGAASPFDVAVVCPALGVGVACGPVREGVVALFGVAAPVAPTGSC
jgi:hypothetical protein